MKIKTEFNKKKKKIITISKQMKERNKNKTHENGWLTIATLHSTLVIENNCKQLQIKKKNFKKKLLQIINAAENYLINWTDQ